jgi:hypothetical protein
MIKSGKTASGALTLCFGLRHLGIEREIVVLKVDGGNFYAFPPYAKSPLGDVDGHMSWHSSGERHVVSQCRIGSTWKTDARTQNESRVMLPAPSALKGAGALFHSGIFPFQFPNLLPAGSNRGHCVVLDTQAANFRDDFIVIRVYLVEPGMENRVPIIPDTGPRILHFVKQTIPWLAVEVYQQTEIIPQRIR